MCTKHITIIERIKDLQKKITPGQWIKGGHYTVRTAKCSTDWICRTRDVHHKHCDEEDEANAELIVKLHDHLPTFLEMVEASEDLLNDVRKRYPEIEKEGFSCPFFQKLNSVLNKLKVSIDLDKL